VACPELNGVDADQSHPVVEAFFECCYEQRQRTDLINSNPLAKALVYVDNHQEQLKTYLRDPDYRLIPTTLSGPYG
jgi:hypothetical protein